MITTEEGMPARYGPTNRLALGICRIGLTACWDVTGLETAEVPSS